MVIANIIEAIEDYLAGDNEAIAECMLFLKNNVKGKDNVSKIFEWFEEHNTCPICGTKKELYSIRERHDEIDSTCYDWENFYMCPNCSFMHKFEE